MSELYDNKGNLLLRGDFDFVEDSVLAYDCEDCDAWVEFPDEEDSDECKECGSQNIIIETCNEGMKCYDCITEFTSWTDVYIHNKDSDIRMCQDCFENVPEEDKREGYILVHFNGFLKPTQISDLIFRYNVVSQAIKEANLNEDLYSDDNTILLPHLDFSENLAGSVRVFATDKIVDADNSFELLKAAITQ